MTDITINLEQFTKTLSSASNKTMGWVWLKPTPTPTNETTLPLPIDPVPSVMGSYLYIDNTTYRFSYKSVRYVRLAYIMERGGSYQAGELSCFHNFITTVVVPTGEATLPTEPVFTPPTIAVLGDTSNLGVSFSFIHDTTSSGTDPKFALAYKITDASTAAFPRFNAAYITAISPEDNI